MAVVRSEIITDIRRLESLREPWKELLSRSTNDEPMASPAWLLAWWRIFGSENGRALRAVALFEGARLVGLAPLLVREERLTGGILSKKLELVGTGEDERDEIGSDYLSLIVERGAERSVLGAFVDALESGALGSWDELVLAPMKGECPVGVFLADALRARGFTVSLDVVSASFHVPLPKTWDAYLAALPSSRRQMVRRSIRAFERWAGDDLSFDVVTTHEEAMRVKEELVHLHGTRWQKEGRDGAFASSRFSAFHDRAMPALVDEGALELVSLRAKGRVVAALYNIVWRDKVHFYQCGRAVDLPPDLRPGIVIHARAMANAIERGLREYDFLPSLARYKVELSLASRPIVALRAARPTAFEVVRRAASLAVEHARARKHGRIARSLEEGRPSAEEADGGEPALKPIERRASIHRDTAEREAVDRAGETLEAR
jgi:CelD/BcsL family acetyltransferase involved in cellulose biosynthesis